MKLLQSCARSARHKVCTLTFEEYLTLTRVNKCYYCARPIKRSARSTYKNGDGRQYFLDRVDNARGYSMDNVVVACSLCNLTRHTRFSSEEFRLIGRVIAKIMGARESAQT